MILGDQLSLGVIMGPHHERVAIEIEIERFTARVYPGLLPTPRRSEPATRSRSGYVDSRPPGVKVDDALLVLLAEKGWAPQPSRLALDLDPEILNARAESERLADNFFGPRST